MATQKPESRLVGRIIRAIKTVCPNALVIKHSDRSRRGLPDLQIIYAVPKSLEPRILFLEVKMPNGRLTKLQEQFPERLRRALKSSPWDSRIRYSVARSVPDVITALTATLCGRQI